MHWITFSDARAYNQLFYLYLERDAMRMGGYKMLRKYAICYGVFNVFIIYSYYGMISTCRPSPQKKVVIIFGSK